ncbi:carbohydrate ABC transporter permease [Alsobacter sp. R-9]
MRTRTFAAFVAPSMVMMVLFIALPLVSVFMQSFYNTRVVYRDEVVEKCTPGFPAPRCEKETRSIPVAGPDGKPVRETVYVGLDNYRTLLRTSEVSRLLGEGLAGVNAILAIDFYRALRFTLTFTFITLPIMLAVGMGLALALNATVQSLRGPIIFVSLLPFIITPVIGALSIKWLFTGDGLMTAALSALLGQRVSLLSNTWTLEALMMFYRVWHNAPFAFIIFYAGLQTLDQDAVDASVVDGASRFERFRYVVLPHLMPLVVFVSLIHLMDAYRVFDEVVGFSSQAYVISLQWLTYDLLMPDNTGNRSIARASASSMLTMIGIVILLIPLIRRTWRDYGRR